MIQTYTWELSLDGYDRDQITKSVDSMGAGIMARTSFMKGITWQPINETFLEVSVRVHGKDRWGCQAHAKMIAAKLFDVGILRLVPKVHTKTVTEPNRWALKDGEGRTPRPRPPRTNPLPS